MRWRRERDSTERLVAGFREKALAAIDAHTRQATAALDELRAEAKFLGYCCDDLRDQIACLKRWPVTVDGGMFCGSPGCGKVIAALLVTGDNALAAVEAHVLNDHPDAFKTMRRPFDPPGWRSDDGETWFPEGP